MGSPKEIRPKSFTNFVEELATLQARSTSQLWYRGCGKATYSLRPSLYRHPKKKKLPELATLETELMTRFRQRSIPFHNRNFSDDWDALFFMQHYGVPTRLLDWTENPFFGLYFAVMYCPSASFREGLKFKSDAALWILDPVSWNRHALKHQHFEGEILTPGDEALNPYKPKTSFSQMNNYPVGLYGAHNSPRIVAQRGAFTIFGQNLDSMEKAFARDSFPVDSLTKIVIEKSRIPNFRKSILSHGISESVVFPDLDGLAREIKQSFNFNN